MVIALEWFWAYLTYRPGTRLITGDHPIIARKAAADVIAERTALSA